MTVFNMLRPVCSCVSLKGTILTSSRRLLHISKDTLLFESTSKRPKLIGFLGVTQAVVLFQVGVWSIGNLPAFNEWHPPATKEEMKEDEEDELLSFVMSKTKMSTWYDDKGDPLPLANRATRMGLMRMSLVASILLYIGTLLYCTRCIHSITLLKPGNTVLFRTYKPVVQTFNEVKIPLNQVSMYRPRVSCKRYMPFKVLNHKWKYLAYLPGNFPRSSLFDGTVGLYRSDVGGK